MRTKMTRRTSGLISIGLLMTTTPSLFRDHFQTTDLLRGLFTGIGVGLMLWAIILQKKRGTVCSKDEPTSE